MLCGCRRDEGGQAKAYSLLDQLSRDPAFALKFANKEWRAAA